MSLLYRNYTRNACFYHNSDLNHPLFFTHKVAFNSGYSFQSITLFYTVCTTVFLLLVTVFLVPSKRELFDTLSAKELLDNDESVEIRRRDSNETFEDLEGAFSSSFAWLSTSQMFVSR